MTAIIATGTPSPTQHLRPSTLNTLEKELLWALLLFHRLNQSKDLLLSDNSTNQQSAYQRFTGKDDLLYLGFTVFIPVDSDYEVGTLQPWEYAIELNNAVASTRYNV